MANGTTSQYIRGDGSLATYSDTTYSAMSVAEGIAGTATSLRTMRADYLKQIIQHYDTNSVTGIRAGASGTTTNSTATNPYIKVIDDNTYRSQIRLVGSGATTVSSDASGNITISSTDSNTTYSTGTLAQLNAGTDTTGRLQTAKLLNDWLNPKLDGKLDKSGGALTSNASLYAQAFNSHLNLKQSDQVDGTFVGISYSSSMAANYGWSAGAIRKTGGNSDFVFKNHVNSIEGVERVRISGSGTVTATTFVGALSGNADSATNLSRSVLAGTGLSGGGVLNANRTLSLDLTYTDGRYLGINSKAVSSTVADTVQGTTITITITGNANTYYPVVITGAARKTLPTRVSV